LDAGIEVVHAVSGNVQLFNARTRTLQIIAHRGFDRAFLQLFENVHADEPSACSRAFRDRRRVVIFDVSTDSQFAPYLSIARANGFRSVQSTPIFAQDDSVTGMLSTHFPEVRQLSEPDNIALDTHAAAIATLLSDLLEVKTVSLRHHPANIEASWPPTWTHISEAKRLRGEIGVLSGVYRTRDDTKSCYLVMEHKGETYIGVMMLENAAFSRQVCSLLQQHIGHPVAEIGSLNLTYTPRKVAKALDHSREVHPVVEMLERTSRFGGQPGSLTKRERT
jgi:hypothetical protein